MVGLYWLVNVALSGHWDPLVALNGEDDASWEGARTMLVGELDSEQIVAWLAPFGAAIAVALIPPVMWKGPLRFVSMAVHAGLGIWALYVCYVAVEDGTGRTMTGLFSVTPVAAYGLMGSPWSREHRALWVFSVTFVVQVLALDSSGTSGGLQFGARLLLPALPALVGLAALVAAKDARRTNHRWLAAASLAVPAMLLSASLWAMGRGLPEANEIATKAEVAAERAAEAEPDVVVTRRWWESQVLAPVLLEGKRIYNKHGRPTSLLSGLAEHGIERVVFVSKGEPDFTLHSGHTVRLQERWPGWLEIQHLVFEEKEDQPER